METICTLLTQALGYILKGAVQSKTASVVKEELLGRFWNWIRPSLIKDLPEVENTPESPDTEKKVQDKLLKLVQNEDFFKGLAGQVATLQAAGIKTKNVVHGDIKRVKKLKLVIRNILRMILIKKRIS